MMMKQRRQNFGTLMKSEDKGGKASASVKTKQKNSSARSPSSSSSSSGDASPNYDSNYLMSPYCLASPYAQSPWIITAGAELPRSNNSKAVFIGSIVREEGHVYSLAASGGFLFSGSDSKNIRVWRNLKDLSGFKSGSGFVKAIVVGRGKIFTGHQDGKIRVWKMINGYGESDEAVSFKRTGSLPSLKESIKSSVNPKNYVEVRRKKRVLAIKHYDAVSCMSMDNHLGLLYSGSWDKTVKVWNVSKGYKFLETIPAHEDAVNSVAAGFDALLFTGSADGTVKAWRREIHEKGTRHFLYKTMLRQDHAVTSIAVNSLAEVVYGGTSDGAIHFWEGKRHLRYGGVLKSHSMAVLCLVSAGRIVISGGADRTVSVWRRGFDGSHVLHSVLDGHGGPVKCLAVEEEGRRGYVVYSGSLDRSIRVWRLPHGS